MRACLVLVLLPLWVTSGLAQTSRTYLVPRVGDGQSRASAYRAKYFCAHVPTCGGDFRVKWTGRPYGDEPLYLVTADLTDDQHAALMMNPDVVQLVASRATAQDVTQYAALRLPVEANEPLVPTVQDLFTVAQRLKGLGVSTAGKSLDATLSADERTRLDRAGTRLPLNTTYTELLRTLAAEEAATRVASPRDGRVVP